MRLMQKLGDSAQILCKFYRKLHEIDADCVNLR